MLLKKQTVWLLTMLSLVVVLSVYYITTPQPKGQDLAALQGKVKDQAEKKQGNESTDAKSEIKVISSAASDEGFEALRLQLEDLRSKQTEDLQDVVASTDLPADQRNNAAEQMKKLADIANKEKVLETLIKTMGYEDALVRADGEKVNITVKSKKEASSKAANDIIQQVRTEIGEMRTVSVAFEPAK
jgi:stage III sporulation protein AH